MLKNLFRKIKLITMLHNEHLRRADESYEIRHDHNGNAIHVYIKDGNAIVFPCLQDFINYLYLGQSETERFYIEEDNLSDLYKSKSYSYYELKKIAEKI